MTLLPCPFCGGERINPIGWLSISPYGEKRTSPACDDCGASAESLAAWNRRAPGPGYAAGAEAMREAAVKHMESYAEFSSNPVDIDCYDYAARAISGMPLPEEPK